MCNLPDGRVGVTHTLCGWVRRFIRNICSYLQYVKVKVWKFKLLTIYLRFHWRIFSDIIKHVIPWLVWNSVWCYKTLPWLPGCHMESCLLQVSFYRVGGFGTSLSGWHVWRFPYLAVCNFPIRRKFSQFFLLLLFYLITSVFENHA